MPASYSSRPLDRKMARQTTAARSRISVPTFAPLALRLLPRCSPSARRRRLAISRTVCRVLSRQKLPHWVRHRRPLHRVAADDQKRHQHHHRHGHERYLRFDVREGQMTCTSRENKRSSPTGFQPAASFINTTRIKSRNLSTERHTKSGLPPRFLSGEEVNHRARRVRLYIRGTSRCNLANGPRLPRHTWMLCGNQ